MGMRITTNMPSITAQRHLANSQRIINKSFSQLASGSRINKASDDAAGLAISETFKSQIRGYKQAQRNANDAQSVVQVAEGGTNEISNILVRLRELAVQSASDTISDRERGFVNNEVSQLINESQRIALSTRFGNTALLDGSAGIMDFQVDINNDDFIDRIQFDAGQQVVTTDALGITDFDFSTKEGAKGALGTIEIAQNKVSAARANLGAIGSRLIKASDNLAVSHENLSAANSRMRDADVADSTAELTRNNILLNASVATLAQANVNPQMALRLLNTAV